MAIRVYFVGGEAVALESETLAGLFESLDGSKGSFVHYPQDNLVIVIDKVTHAEDLDAMPTGEETSD